MIFDMQYTLVRSKRRTIAIEIKKDGNVVVRAPLFATESRINAFIGEKSAWINKHLKAIENAEVLPKFTTEELKAFVKEAKRVLPEKVRYFAERIGVNFRSVSIRKARTLWGSCTARGGINLNCLLVLLPTEICDYVIIHELCHRKQMNHSRAFWKEVEKYCKDYKSRRKILKDYGEKLLQRL